ncbi:MAG: tyrosine-type recombinase/integrase [Planctomycetes bacterium]|nr:tyrosine-type recombinase/integrase [Planctomycetota bacterium]
MFFFGIKSGQPFDETYAVRRVKAAAKRAKIRKAVKVHTLRHCFATHALEDGVPIRTIQKEMGHSTMKTTLKYFQYIPEHWQTYTSPFETLLQYYKDKKQSQKGKPGGKK